MSILAAAITPALLEQLVARGFEPVAYPMYPNALGVRRGNFAGLLVPAEGGGLRLLAEPSYLIEGNFSVRINRSGRAYFVWKKKEAEATPDLLEQLHQFAADVTAALATIS